MRPVLIAACALAGAAQIGSTRPPHGPAHPLGDVGGGPAARAPGVLVVEVRDVQQQPVAGLTVTAGGNGTAPQTDQLGRARVRLDGAVRPGMVVPLRVVAPRSRTLVLFSPWDEQTVVPAWDNEAVNFIRVVVVAPGVRQALASGTFLQAFIERSEGRVARAAGAGAREGAQAAPTLSRDSARAELAREVGLPPAAIDSAIRAWGRTTTDLYQKGLAALYAQNYPEAVTNLQASLRARDSVLAKAQADVYNAAFFLGRANYEQGRYRDAATAYAHALQARPEDLTALNNRALALARAGALGAADSLHVRILAVYTRLHGPNDPSVAAALTNLAQARASRGDYAGADTLLLRALAIYDGAAVGDPNRPAALASLAAVRADRGDLASADSLARRALTLDVAARGPDHVYAASDRQSLAAVRAGLGDLAGADTLLLQALAVYARVLAPDHPRTASALNLLAVVRRRRGDLLGADTLAARALAAHTRVLGPTHWEVARDVQSLASVRRDAGDLAAADTLYARALAVGNEALGRDHPRLAGILRDLGSTRLARRDLAGADTLVRQALALDERTYGAGSLEVGADADLAGQVADARGDLAAADSLYARALAVRQQRLGADDRDTRATRARLAAVRTRASGRSVGSGARP